MVHLCSVCQWGLDPFAQRIAGDGFQTPIDEIDAAARILDPVMVGLNHDELHYGVFFKDYRLTEW